MSCCLPSLLKFNFHDPRWLAKKDAGVRSADRLLMIATPPIKHGKHTALYLIGTELRPGRPKGSCPTHCMATAQ
jgi:hypothetical protein